MLNPHNIDALALVEAETGCRIYNILQLRLHPSIIGLKKSVQGALAKGPDKIFDVDLTYLTSRGNWYFRSWKAEC